jgi:hypothetical protein
VGAISLIEKEAKRSCYRLVEEGVTEYLIPDAVFNAAILGTTLEVMRYWSINSSAQHAA